MPLEDGSRFFRLQLGNFDLALPVLMALLQLHVAVALLNKHQRVRHLFFKLDHDSFLLLSLVLQSFNTLESLLDVKLLLLFAHLLELHVMFDFLSSLSGNLQVFFEFIKGQYGVSTADFECE